MKAANVLSCAGILALVASCSSTAETPTVAGGANRLPIEVRRSLRNEASPVEVASARRGSLPFAATPAAPAFVPVVTPPDPSAALSLPAAASVATFSLPAAFAPMPERPGSFALRGRDSSAVFDAHGFTLALAGGTKEARKATRLHASIAGGREVQPLGEKLQRGYVNRFVDGPSRQQTHIPTYGQLAWEEIQPGVDWVVDTARGGFAYELVVSPGVKLADVAIHWDGATALHAVDEGRGVDLDTALGTLHVRGLRAFAIEGSQRVELPARFVVRGDDITTEVDGWDGRTTLLIDPTIAWSSLIGGSSVDTATAIAVDGSGDAIVVGRTESTDFPTVGPFSTGPLSTTFGYLELQEGFVAKISGAGTLLWSSYTGHDAVAVAVDASGNAFIAGVKGIGWKATAGFDTIVCGAGSMGGYAPAVTKVSGTGERLWARPVCGTHFESDIPTLDKAYGVAVDSAGNAFITGGTSATDFPSDGGFATFHTGSCGDNLCLDAFVTKLSGAGTILWSSYLGGTNIDAGTGIAVDGSGNALIVGQTYSTDFPTTGGFDSTHKGSFVTKVSGAGKLLWSSYLGVSYTSDNVPVQSPAVAVDAGGNAFITGITNDASLDATSGFQKTYGGAGDAYVMKVSGGGALLWTSYLGGKNFDGGKHIAVDGSGNAVVVGYTTSSDFPTAGGFDTTFIGGSCTCPSSGAPVACACADAFVTKVSGAGALLWSSYLGGNGTDLAFGVAIEASGNAWIAGETSSTNFPSTGGFDTVLAGTSDGFVTKLAVAPPCTTDAQCTTGHCADGFCCDKACTGGCEACSNAKKGKGVDGVCEPVAADTDPKSACAPGTGTCAADGMCDGAGSCRAFAKAGAACGSPSCSGGAATVSTCAGDSATCVPTTTACAPFGCGASACNTTCASDGDCAATAYCASATCVAKLASGSACTGANECASGFCADGVCCNAACTGQCEACDATGSCKPVTGAPPGGRPACGTSSPECVGACDGVNGAACSYDTTHVCAQTCTAGQQTVSRCDASGACTAAAPQSCGGFACALGVLCKTTCSADSDCEAKYTCHEGKCVPVGPACSADGASSKDGDKTTSCSPYICDATTGTCRSTCSSGSDCVAGFECTSGVCTMPSPSPSASPSASAPATPDSGGCSLAGVSPRAQGRSAAVLFALAALAQLRRRARGRLRAPR